MEIRNVDVYRNLSQGCWSVKDRSDGRVIGRADAVIVTDATFVVQPAGRAKVLREGQKNVHAFVRGTLSDIDIFNQECLSLPKEVTYNPYKYDSFVDKTTQEPVYYSPFARLSHKQVLVA